MMTLPRPGTKDFEAVVSDYAFGKTDEQTAAALRAPAMLDHTVQALQSTVRRICRQLESRTSGYDAGWRERAMAVRARCEATLDELTGEPGYTNRLEAAIRTHRERIEAEGEPSAADLDLWATVATPEVP